MNPSTSRFLLVVAALVCNVQSSFRDPTHPILPPTPAAHPARYGNHIEQLCGIDFVGGWSYDGTCVFPSSADQCMDGIGVRTTDRSRRPCPIIDLDSENQRSKMISFQYSKRSTHVRSAI